VYVCGRERQRARMEREIECLLNDNHKKGKMMIMIMKTFGSQVNSPVAEGKRKEGGGRNIMEMRQKLEKKRYRETGRVETR